jgi:hypothetical protein
VRWAKMSKMSAIFICGYSEWYNCIHCPIHLCLDTMIKGLHGMESAILICIGLHMAAIVEIQDVCHIDANNHLVIFKMV